MSSTMLGPDTPWAPDLGDGTYRNPVLYADYSDPDAIRVGDDYWLTASSFTHVPGLPILHSRDLVNWALVAHALPALVPRGHFSVPRHGCGVWAPAIRHHRGRYWIYYPDPDFGLYVVTADDPGGRWSDPVMVKQGRGLIDPCPFWDDDGRGYLVHGWSFSRAKIKNRLTLHRLADDGLSVADEGAVVFDGDQTPDWRVVEGPKLYKREGEYYIFAPAGGVPTGYQGVFRSRNLWGPYERRIVLDQGSTAVNGPHQGAWVDTPAGEDWFLHFQDVPGYGRLVHLQPMIWKDGWPVMGRPVGNTGKGEPVLIHRKPKHPPQSPAVPATSDEFDGSALGPQWQWQANPSPDWLSLKARAGWLRLDCAPLAPGAAFRDAPHLLMQKFPAPGFTAAAVMDFHPLGEGDCAGLTVFGKNHARLEVRRMDGRLQLFLFVRDQPDGPEEAVSLGEFGPSLELRVRVSPGARCRFAFGPAGGDVREIDREFVALSGDWVGAKVGLFASRPAGGAPGGHADFDWFRVSA